MLSEYDIISGCKKGNPDAQRHLYLRYAPLAKAVCRRYIRDNDLISDLLQESFVKVFSQLKTYKGDGSLEGWVRRIVVNTCISQLRKQKNEHHEVIYDQEFLAEPAESDKSIIDHLIEAGFSKDVLVDMIHKLPENYAAVFNMFYIDELNHKEIAVVMNIGEAISRKWIHRAKSHLRKLLTDYLDNKAKEFLK